MKNNITTAEIIELNKNDNPEKFGLIERASDGLNSYFSDASGTKRANRYFEESGSMTPAVWTDDVDGWENV